MSRKRRNSCTTESCRKSRKLSVTSTARITESTKDRPLQYPALEPGPDSFRLLKLLIGRRNEEIRCELYTASVQKQQNMYTALSYTWGPSISAKNIVVNDHRLTVRENLYDFFQSCVTRQDFPVLWIDAICINQAEVTERNHQVGNMGETYKTAEQVYAWLGRGCPDSNWYLGYLSRYSATAMTRYLNKRAISFQQEVRFEQGREWINSRRNWSRIWVVQEILLVKSITVICGEKSVSWDCLEELEDLLDPQDWHIGAQPLSVQFFALQKSRRAKPQQNGDDLADLVRQYGENAM